MKKLLFLLAIITASLCVHAQVSTNRFIATDYNSCLHGVKDSLGTWVVEPKYEYLSWYYNGFIVSNSGHYGQIDTNGNVTVPMMYDYITYVGGWDEAAIGNYATVFLNDKLGVIDSVNNIIVPIQYEKIHVTADSLIVVASGKQWELYKLNGEHHKVPWKLKQGPQYAGRRVYECRKRTLFGFRYGVCNDSGRIILPLKYDNIEGFNRHKILRVSKNGKYGYCSSAGKVIWPMIFSTRKNERMHEGSILTTARRGTGPACIEGRCGLINMQGDTILPFRYEEIKSFGYRDDNTLWIVRENGLYGIFDHESGWKLEPTCSTIRDVTSFYADGDSAVVGLIVAQRDQFWGAMLTTGQVVIPFTCTSYLYHSGEHFFLRNDTIFQLSVMKSWARNLAMSHMTGALSYTRYKWTYDEETFRAPASGMFSSFTGKKGIVAWYHPGHTDGELKFGDTVYSAGSGAYHGMLLPDSVLFATTFFVKPLTKVVHSGNDFQAFHYTTSLRETDTTYNAPQLCLVRTKSAALDMSTVTYIVKQEKGSDYIVTGRSDVFKSNGSTVLNGDTINAVTVKRHGKDGSIFFSSESDRRTGKRLYTILDSTGHIEIADATGAVADFNRSCYWREKSGERRWELIDRSTGKNILDKKADVLSSAPLWDSITVVNSCKSGKRLFNISRRRYLTSYGFSDVRCLNIEGTLFAVKTCAGHMGIMDVAGHWLLDTNYTAFTPAVIDTSFVGGGADGNGSSSITYHRYLVFHGSHGISMFDTRRKEIVKRDVQTQLLWEETVHSVNTPRAEQELRDSSGKFSTYDVISLFLSQKDNEALLPWHKQCLMDSLYAPQRFEESYNHFWYGFYGCNHCARSGASHRTFHWTMNYDGRGAFFLFHRSDSLLSFSRFERGFLNPVQLNSFSNVMLFSDGPHQLSLDSLFNPQTDWRNFIINTVITYVNTHQHITGDCTNPAGLPTQLQHSFLLTPEGLRLYPPGFTERSAQVEITIPWKDADPFIRSDVRSRLPINSR